MTRRHWRRRWRVPENPNIPHIHPLHFGVANINCGDVLAAQHDPCVTAGAGGGAAGPDVADDKTIDRASVSSATAVPQVACAAVSLAVMVACDTVPSRDAAV